MFSCPSICSLAVLRPSFLMLSFVSSFSCPFLWFLIDSKPSEERLSRCLLLQRIFAIECRSLVSKLPRVVVFRSVGMRACAINCRVCHPHLRSHPMRYYASQQGCSSYASLWPIVRLSTKVCDLVGGAQGVCFEPIARRRDMICRYTVPFV